jgi:pimeloyl-ACP methyl ester carboxylesterase
VTRRILYLHGFASSPRGRKAQALRQILEVEGWTLEAPDLNVPSFERLDFDAMVGAGLDAARRGRPAVVVGSSLGALVALGAARAGVDAPLVLVAPALGIADRWESNLPAGDPVRVFHFGREREQPIHRAFFERMRRVDADRFAPDPPVTIVMGRLDESVPYERVEEVWRRWVASGRLAAGSRFVGLSDGDHGLGAHVTEIAREIRTAAR